MLNERVSAGVKILGFYFLFIGLEKLVSLALALVALKEETKQFNTYLGAPSTSIAHAFTSRQVIVYLIGSLFYFIAAILCTRRTSMLMRICGGQDSNGSGEPA